MRKQNYKGHTIEIFDGRDGSQLYISRNGQTLYSARVIRSQALSRAREVIKQISQS